MPIDPERSDVSRYTPNVHEEFTETMYGILVLQNAVCVKLIGYERLRFNSDIDRSLMEQYRKMQGYDEALEQLKFLSPENAGLMDTLLKLTQNQSRNVSLKKLMQHDNVREFAASFYPRMIKNYFDVESVKLEKVVKSPLANHTLRRTFLPDHYGGPDVKLPAKYRQLERKPIVEKVPEIPHVVQGEIAGLDRKFKVSLDTTKIDESIRLMCRLDDDLLPAVPAICIEVPEKYPFCSPTCIIMQHDYSVTPFLTTVQSNLSEYISTFPKLYSISHLLNAWEMSVRKACRAQNQNKQVDSFSMIYDMLMGAQ